MHRSQFLHKWQEISQKLDASQATPENLIGHALRPIQIGDSVWIQNHQTKAWDRQGLVIGATDRNYHLRLPSGTILWRNRRHIRKKVELQNETSGSRKKVTFADQPELSETIRRSKRSKRQPERFVSSVLRYDAP